MTATSPVTLGCCEHIFCSVCCENYLGTACPVCDLPAPAKDAEVDRQLFNMASLCGRLKDILDEIGNKGNDRHCESAEESSIYCTPNQAGLDLGSTTIHDFTEVKVRKDKTPKDKSSQFGAKRRSSIGGVVQVKETVSNNSGMSTPNVNKKQKTEEKQEMSDISNTFTDKTLSDKGETKKRSKSLGCSESINENDRKIKDAIGTSKSSRTTKLRTSKTEDKPTELASNITERMNDKFDKFETPTRNSRQRRSDLSIEEKEMNNSGRKGKRKGANKSKMATTPNSSKDEVANDPQGKEVEKKGIKSTPKGNKKQKVKSQQDDVGSIRYEVGESTGCTSELNNSVISDISGSGNRQKKASNQKKKAYDNFNSLEVTPRTAPGRKHTGNQASKMTDKSHTLSSPGLNKKNAKGETLLHVAAIKNEVSRVLQLLEGGASPNVRDNAGWTPLHEACNHGYTEVARLLLDHGAMMNVPGFENDSPLHDAVSNNRLDCVKLLVSRGASINTRNLHGLTPVDYAKTKEMKEALKTKVTEPQQTEHQMIDVLEYQQPCFVGTGLSREEKSILQKTASQLKIKLNEEITPEVTHIVTVCNAEGMCPRTVKIVQGIITGKWILNMEWLALCKEMNSVVGEEALEVQGLSMFPNCQSPYKGRMNRKQQLPGLFDGCWFYFNGEFEYSIPSKEDLLATIKLGGGKILSREPKPGHLDESSLTVPYHVNGDSEMRDCCNFVVFETGSKIQPIKTKYICSVPASWVIDCAATFSLLPLPE